MKGNSLHEINTTINLEQTWCAVVGKAISNNAEIIHLKKGILTIKTSNPIWRNELSLQKQNLINKIKEAIKYLVKEINNIEDCFLVTDSKRGFSHSDRKLKLAEQGGVCAIDGKPLKLMDAHAAHIVAHSEGGQTDLENMVMVRAIYNTRMGTMDLNTYKETLPKAA